MLVAEHRAQPGVDHVAPGCADRYRQLFRAPVAFSQPSNSIWLDPDQAFESLATANPELVRVNDQIVTDYLAKLDRDDIVMRVRSKLIEQLPSGGGDEARIASELHLSQRSLQRKLKAEGLSFSELLESTRRELGRDYVRDSQHSFNEISYLLGFAEPGNFSRTFRRWYGKTPSEYRLRGAAQGVFLPTPVASVSWQPKLTIASGGRCAA